MKVLVAVILPLISSCRGPAPDWLTQEEMRALANHASEMGYTCAAYQVRPEGYVSDLWVGAPMLSPDGEIDCPGYRIIHFRGIDEDDSFENDLECGFEGFVRVSEWTCVRGDITRLSDSSDNQ